MVVGWLSVLKCSWSELLPRCLTEWIHFENWWSTVTSNVVLPDKLLQWLCWQTMGLCAPGNEHECIRVYVLVYVVGRGGVGVWVDAHLITYSDTCSCGHAVVFAIYCTNTFSGSGGRLPREARLYPVSVRQELHCQDYRRYEGHEEEPHRHRGEYSGTL